MKIKTYKDLDVWKNGMNIVRFSYRETKNFPKTERYALSSQMQRAAVSIPANISEGFTRQYLKEYIQFCYIALGSCSELETLIIIAHEENYITKDSYNVIEEMLNHEGRMITNMIKTLKKHLRTTETGQRTPS